MPIAFAMVTCPARYAAIRPGTPSTETLETLATLGGASHEHVVAWLSSPVAAAFAGLLVLVGAWHALLGLQVVIEDYVGDKGTRVAALLAVKFAFAVAAVIGVLAVLRIASGVAA